MGCYNGERNIYALREGVDPEPTGDTWGSNTSSCTVEVGDALVKERSELSLYIEERCRSGASIIRGGGTLPASDTQER